MIIACLHTAESNIATFEEAAERMGLAAGTLRHTVRPDLLRAAELCGGMTAEIEAETRSVLLMLGQEADGVLLTCSTLGPSAEFSANANATPTLRADRALAQLAVAAGGRVAVLCAAESTLAPTTKMFHEAAMQTGAKVEIILVAGAWDMFKAGEISAYLEAIAAASEAAYASGASVVALAQASMADAGRFVKGPRQPLASPGAGLQAIVERAARG